MYIFDCDRIIGDEEKRTIIENMEGKAEVIFDNSEGYDRDTDIVISTRCVGNRDVAGMEVIIRRYWSWVSLCGNCTLCDI